MVTQVVKEETVDPEDILLLNNTAKELRKSQVHLKMEVQRYFDVLRGQISKVRILIQSYLTRPGANNLTCLC